MAINFTTITDKNTIKDMTIQLNDIGQELTKERNIFDITDDLLLSSNRSQKVKLTDDKGLAKTIPSTTVLRNIREPGYYYIPAKTLATMIDKPELESIDVILHVMPVGSTTRAIQTIYTLSTDNDSIKTVFRYVRGNSSSQWQHIEGLPNNKNTVVSGKNVSDLETPGVYYVTNMMGLPEELTEGFLEISVGTNDNRKAVFTDLSTKKKYTNTKTSTGAYGSWRKEFESVDIQQYVPTKVNPPEGVASYNISIYKSDNISFTKAIENHIIETGETFISFYCQGGVTDNPGGTNSIRGIVMVDNPEDYKLKGFYGNYVAMTTGGGLISGGVSGGTWSTSKNAPSVTTLWTGALSFKTLSSQTMNEDISNYNYVEIYTKHRTALENSGSDRVGTICHKFYIDGDGTYLCAGSLLSGANPPTYEFYNVNIKISGNKFNILNSNVQNGNTQYVTRIVGYNVFS